MSNKKPKINENFNYCIGRFWNGKDGPIATYTYFGEIKYGGMTEAKEFLEYVKTQSPNKDWMVFKLNTEKVEI